MEDDKGYSNTGLTTLARADTDERPPVIALKMERLNDQLSDLDNAFSLLIHKIGAVLNPNASMESDNPRKDAEKPSESDLAMSIERQIARIRNMTWVVREVTERVEL
jgi:hypothetical protein